MKYIIEGIDRLGKSTLAESILNTKGHHILVHFGKPNPGVYYEKSFDAQILYKTPDRLYMEDLNKNMFELCKSKANVIFDRGHLGEIVYAPLYRNYCGSYILDLESDYLDSIKNDTRLILLTTSNFELCVDDGLSHDFNNKESEQNLFLEAFSKSRLNKVVVDVHDGSGGFKTPEMVLSEALNINSNNTK